LTATITAKPSANAKLAALPLTPNNAGGIRDSIIGAVGLEKQWQSPQFDHESIRPPALAFSSFLNSTASLLHHRTTWSWLGARSLGTRSNSATGEDSRGCCEYQQHMLSHLDLLE
jgi:hypothetical protein